MRVKASPLVSVVAFLLSVSAFAQDTAEHPQDTAEHPQDTADHPRFRGAIIGTVGLEKVTSGGTDFSATMYGVEGRLGLQLNNSLAIYAQPYLAFGSFGEGIFGATGTFSTTVLADYTLADRLSLGGGLGYGYYNNPSGPVFHARAGFYPLVGHAEADAARRKGLVIGVDFRYFVLGSGYTGTYLMTAGIGYEKF
jgi:hypothetical protein